VSSQNISILIIEDERPWANFLEEFLGERGYECTVKETGEEGLEAFEAGGHEVVLVDLRLPGIDGNEVTQSIRKRSEDTIIILMTGYPTSNSAIRAFESGATDYITKPFNANQVDIVISRVLEHRRMLEENDRLRRVIESRSCFDQIVGAAPAMQAIYRLLEQIAPSDASVLVCGESGVGKSLVAQAIHRHSGRPANLFESFDCARVEPGEMDASLFGTERQNSSSAGPGALERVGGGTLFLRNVEFLPAASQDRLGQTIQDQQVLRVGSKKPSPFRARLVTATTASLREMAENGSFRQDLYYRLGVVTISVPPLRERREDTPLLANFFLEKSNRAHETRVDKFSFDAITVMSSFDWPGNVGALERVVDELVAMRKAGVINVSDLPDDLQREMALNDNSVSAADVPLREAKRRFEFEYFKDLLRRTKGNMSLASRASRVGRPYLYKKINDYEIDPNDYR
jgi:DNA-binding NtrC family response regulator